MVIVHSAEVFQEKNFHDFLKISFLLKKVIIYYFWIFLKDYFRKESEILWRCSLVHAPKNGPTDF